MAQEKPVTDTCICEIKVDINYIILTEIKINVMVWIYFESNNWSRKFIKDTAWYISHAWSFKEKEKNVYILHALVIHIHVFSVHSILWILLCFVYHNQFFFHYLQLYAYMYMEVQLFLRKKKYNIGLFLSP